MQATGIYQIELLLLALLVLVAALAVLAKRLSIPYPIVLVIGGLCLSILPHAPRISLNPDIVFLVILPPLLFSGAFHISWREFRNNAVSIFMLAFGLVGFTVYGVALLLGVCDALHAITAHQRSFNRGHRDLSIASHEPSTLRPFLI